MKKKKSLALVEPYIWLLPSILLPVAAPGIVTALIFVFINAWNEYTVGTDSYVHRCSETSDCWYHYI